MDGSAAAGTPHDSGGHGSGGHGSDDMGAVTRRLLPLASVVFFAFLSIGIPLPVLPVQVHDVLGFGNLTVGWTVGLESIATLLTRQFAGDLCDARGPRRAVLLGLPLASLAGASYLVSDLPFLPAGVALAVLLAGRVLLGVAESLFLTGTMAWNIARVGVASTGRVMVWQGMAMYGAFGAGSVAGLTLLPVTGFWGVATVAMLMPLAALAIALPLAPVATAAGRRLPFWRVIGRIFWPGLVLGASTVPYGAMTAFLALDFAAHGWHSAGLALACYAAAFIAVRVLLPGVTDRVSGRWVATLSLAVGATGQLLLWSAATPWVAVAGAAVTGGGMSLVFPAMGVEAIRRVPPQNRGAATGGYAAFFDIGAGVAGPLTGAIAAGFGTRAVFLAGAASTLLAGCIAAFVVRPTGRPAG